MSPEDQLRRCEVYVNEVLKPDLRKVCDALDQANNDLAEYEQLNKTIEMMTKYQEQKETFKSMIDIGCSFFMEAHVDDFSAIFLDIGQGCYLEFSLKEAQQFIRAKEKFLHTRLSALREESAKIKGHIKMMLLCTNAYSTLSA